MRVTAGRDRDRIPGSVGVRCDGVDYTFVAFDADDAAGWVKCWPWIGYPNPPGNRPVKVPPDSGAADDCVFVRGRVEFYRRPVSGVP